MSQNKIAAIRVRGVVMVNQTVEDTLRILRLYRKNYCVILPETPSIEGMLRKVKDFITWGSIDDETFRALMEKRGKKTRDREGKEIMVPFFRLNPPRKGFGRKGIKKSFNSGGALGNRKEKINELIKRMI